jgi:hypothetical protein
MHANHYEVYSVSLCTAGAYLIPYVVVLTFIGIPTFFLELIMGQYSGKGPIEVWCVSPIFQGYIMYYSDVLLSIIAERRLWLKPIDQRCRFLLITSGVFSYGALGHGSPRFCICTQIWNGVCSLSFLDDFVLINPCAVYEICSHASSREVLATTLVIAITKSGLCVNCVKF